MTREQDLKFIPDLSSPTGFRVEKIAPKPAIHVKSYKEIHDEVFGDSTSTVEVLRLVNGLLQDIKNLEAENPQ